MPDNEVSLGDFAIEVANDFGPRITNLRRHGGPQLFVSLGPDEGLDHEGGFYRFHGGHRLWAAPEVPYVTYAPDDHTCEIDHRGGSIRVAAPPDRAGVVKEVEVRAEADSLVVEHRLSTPDRAAKAIAPWAITQVPLGGIAVLPLTRADTAPLPDRQIVLWPYTDVTDPRIRIRTRAVTVSALEGPQLKLGVGPSPGRLGYLRDGWLFVKTVEKTGGGEVPDFGAIHQVFVGRGFCELESVGGLETLEPGVVARLIERWTVMECRDEETALGVVAGPEH